MRVVVAGGVGFIGRSIVSCLRASGHNVQPAGRADTHALLARGADVLVWSAGNRHPALELCMKEHCHGPVAALRAVPGLRTMIYLSSGEVYGSQEVPFVEGMERRGSSAYARAKMAGEDALAQACGERGVTLCVLRPSVVYGPEQSGAMFVPSVIRALVSGQRVPMTAGEQTRDFVHVEDVAAAASACVLARASGTWNVSSGEERRLLDVAHLIAAQVDPGAASLLGIGELPYREGEQMRYVLNCTRAREELGWQARVGLHAGIAECVARARRD